jgi:hypothetical protein
VTETAVTVAARAVVKMMENRMMLVLLNIINCMDSVKRVFCTCCCVLVVVDEEVEDTGCLMYKREEKEGNCGWTIC